MRLELGEKWEETITSTWRRQLRSQPRTSLSAPIAMFSFSLSGKEQCCVLLLSELFIQSISQTCLHRYQAGMRCLPDFVPWHSGEAALTSLCALKLLSSATTGFRCTAATFTGGSCFSQLHLFPRCFSSF